MGGPPMGGPGGMRPPGGMQTGEFMGPAPDLSKEPIQAGKDAGLVAELKGLLANWTERTPNTPAGQYFQELAQVVAKYA